MNKVMLIGRLTKDSELKFIPGSGTAVAIFTLAIERRFSKDGNKEADFIPIVVWGKQAEATANYMSKGKRMGIAGRIQTRSYEAKDGTRRYITEVVAEEVQFLEWGNRQSTADPINGGYPQIGMPGGFDGSYSDNITPIDDGEIPF